jgi:hypothetical protein
MPLAILRDIIRRFFPKLERQLTRTMTMPQMPTMASHRDDPRSVPYISFDAIAGRNSSFPLLTNEQLEEIGGVEYRALNALLWIVAGVSAITQRDSETFKLTLDLSVSYWYPNVLLCDHSPVHIDAKVEVGFRASSAVSICTACLVSRNCRYLDCF